MHPQTLRIYERKGLLAPARTSGGNRRYSEWDLARLRRIGELTREGCNLVGVKRVLELEERIAALEQELEQVRAEARAAVERIERAHRRELVPLAQSVVRYGHIPRILRRDDD